MKHVKNFFLKSGLFVVVMAMVFVSCDRDDDFGTDNNGQQGTEEVKKATAVALEYTNWVTEDMLKYCDIVLMYNDGTGEKAETITSIKWNKSFVAALPCTFTFKKTVTLKEGIDMTSVEKVEIYKNGYSRSYELLDADGQLMKKGEVSSNLSSMTPAYANFLEGIEKGSFNTTNTYVFDAEGNLK